jgi:hypothetical protein
MCATKASGRHASEESPMEKSNGHVNSQLGISQVGKVGLPPLFSAREIAKSNVVLPSTVVISEERGQAHLPYLRGD